MAAAEMSLQRRKHAHYREAGRASGISLEDASWHRSIFMCVQCGRLDEVVVVIGAVSSRKSGFVHEPCSVCTGTSGGDRSGSCIAFTA